MTLVDKSTSLFEFPIILGIYITFIPQGGFPRTTPCGRHSLKCFLLPFVTWFEIFFYSLPALSHEWVGGWMLGSVGERMEVAYLMLSYLGI